MAYKFVRIGYKTIIEPGDKPVALMDDGRPFYAGTMDTCLVPMNMADLVKAYEEMFNAGDMASANEIKRAMTQLSRV